MNHPHFPYNQPKFCYSKNLLPSRKNEDISKSSTRVVNMEHNVNSGVDQLISWEYKQARSQYKHSQHSQIKNVIDPWN